MTISARSSSHFSHPRRPLRRRAAAALLAGLFLLAPMVGEVALAAGTTGLPLPRFVSLRKDEVNVRTGPGIRYPVDWVFTYRHMPVEIVAEFESWRKIRDWQGTVGWVHASMLSGRRWVMVRDSVQPLHRAAAPHAPVVARVEARVLGRLKQCRDAWCEVEIAGLEGWIRRAALWGVYPDEKVE